MMRNGRQMFAILVPDCALSFKTYWISGASIKRWELSIIAEKAACNIAMIPMIELHPLEMVS